MGPSFVDAPHEVFKGTRWVIVRHLSDLGETLPRRLALRLAFFLSQADDLSVGPQARRWQRADWQWNGFRSRCHTLILRTIDIRR
jgi:hypothetical protein